MDNSTQPDLANCYPAAEASPANEFRKQMVFWVEGVALLVVASFGIVGNVLTCAVLRRISLNNVFNQLIVVLASVDSVFAGLCRHQLCSEKGFWGNYVHVPLLRPICGQSSFTHFTTSRIQSHFLSLWPLPLKGIIAIIGLLSIYTMLYYYYIYRSKPFKTLTLDYQVFWIDFNQNLMAEVTVKLFVIFQFPLMKKISRSNFSLFFSFDKFWNFGNFATCLQK